MGFQEDLEWLASSDYEIPSTAVNVKSDKLAKRAEEKRAKLQGLGTYSRGEFSDADSTGFASDANTNIRLKDHTLQPGQWVDTPESQYTAQNYGIYDPTVGHKVKLDLTPEEQAAYNASMMALDNFAMGTTPASAESWEDMRNNPLTPENQALYNKTMQDMRQSGEFDNLSAFGVEGATDSTTSKRQLGNFVNEAYNPDETLTDRYLNTGNAELRGTSTGPIADPNFSFQQSYGANLVDGIQGALGSAAAKVGDMVMDFSIRAAKELSEKFAGIPEEEANALLYSAAENAGLSGLVNKKGNFVALDKYKEMSEYGYDDSRIQEYTKEFKDVIDSDASLLEKAWVVVKGIQHFPEVLATSAGEMALASLPMGMAVLAASTTNDFLEERSATKGTSDLDAEDYAIAGTMGVVYAAVNQFTKGMAGLKPTSEAVKEMVTGLGAEGGKAVIAKLGGMLANGAFKGFEEGVEEIIQGSAEVIGTKYKTSKEDEILTKDTALDLAVQGTLGMGAGVGSSIAGDTVSKVGEAAATSKDYIKEKVGSKPSKKDVDSFNKRISAIDKVLNPEKKITKDEATGEVKEEPIIQHTEEVMNVGNKVANGKDLTPEEEQYREANKDAIETYLSDKKNLHENLSSMHADLRAMEKKFTDEIFAKEIKSRKAAVEAKMKEEGMEVPTAPNENSNTVSKEELTKVSDTYKEIISKGVLGEEDMQRIVEAESILERRIDELRESDEDTADKEKNIKGIKAELLAKRTELAKQLDASPVSDIPTFGSKESAGDYIEAILSSDIKESDSLTEKLNKIAKEAGIDEDMYKSIRDQAKKTKDWYAVDIESKDSSRGYKTQGKVLRNLINNPAPDEKQITKLVGTMQNYAKTQKNYADTVTNKIEEIQTQINDYNKNPNIRKIPGRQVKGNSLKYAVDVEIKQVSSTSKRTIYINKDSKGKLSIDTAAHQIVKTKLENYNEILDILSEHGKKLEELGLSTKDTGVKTSFVGIKEKSTETLADSKYYKEHKVNKVITAGDTKWDDTKNTGYSKGNEDKINNTSYSADDVVLISVNPGNTEEYFNKQYKAEMQKLVNAAKKAGATIIIDRKSTKFNKKILGQLTKAYGTQEYETVREIKGSDTSEKSAAATNVYKPKSEIASANAVLEKEVEKHNKTIKDFESKHTTIVREYISTDTLPDNNPAQVIKDRFITDGKFDYDKYVKYVKSSAKTRIDEALETVKEFHRLDEKDTGSNDPYFQEAKKAYKKLPEFLRNKAEEVLRLEQTEESKISELLQAYREAVESENTGAAEYIWNRLIDQDQVIIADIINNSSYKDAPITYRAVKANKDGTLRTVPVFSPDKAKDTVNGVLTEQPLALTDILDTSKTTTNLINSLPVMSMGSKIINYTNTMKGYLHNALASEATLKKSPKKDAGPLGKEALWSRFSTNPGRALLFGKDMNDEVINDNVALAMALVRDEYIAINSRMLDDGYKSDVDIARMLNIEETAVTNEIRALFRDNGMLKKTLANSLGKAVFSKLGIKPNKDLDIEVYNKISADIGNMVALSMVSSKQFVITEVTAADYATALGKDTKSVFDEDAKIQFIKFKPTSNKDRRQSQLDDAKELYGSINETLVSENTFRKEGSLKPITHSPHEGKVAKSKAELETAKEAEQVMQKLRDMKWSVDIVAIEDILINEDSLKEWLGFTEDTDGMSEFDAVGQVSKNRDILKSIDELKLITKKMKTLDNKDDKLTMYFDWFYSSNGRYMMDSNTLNPQTDKLHRFLVQPEAHIIDVTKKGDTFVDKDGTNITDNVYYALAQAFGHAVDKKVTREIREVGKALLASTPKELKDLIRNNPNAEFIVVQGKVKLLTEKNAKIAGDNAIKLEIEHISHAYQAVDFLSKAQKNGTFKTSLTAETDAVTSGFALKLMQMPILEESLADMLEWFNKTGIFFGKQLGLLKDKGLKENSMNDVLSTAGFLDSYQTLASKVVVGDSSAIKKQFDDSIFKDVPVKFSNREWDVIKGLLPETGATLKEVSKDLRALFKDPFMTFNYSAGIQSIRRSLANKLTNKLVTKAINAKKGTPEWELLKALADATSIKPEMLKIRMATEPLYSIKKKEDGPSVEQILNIYIDSSFGHSVQEVMEAKFKPFMDAHKKINNAFKAMFILFNKEYKDAIQELRTTQTKVTDADKLVIIEKLREKFPGIRGPLQAKGDGAESNIGIYKTGTATPNPLESSVHPAQTYKKDGVSNVIRHEIKVFEEAISSGSVVPIHYIDAAIMGKLFNKMSNFTAIHDAIMMPLNKLNDGAKEYNKLYFEVGTDYSFVKEINNRLEKLSEEDLKGKYYGEPYTTEYVNKKPVDVSRKDFIQRSIKEFKELNDLVDDRRSELKTLIDDEGAAGMHMAALPEGVYYTDNYQSVGAAQPGDELNPVYITAKEFEGLKAYNQAFKDKYPEMFSIGEDFRYFPETNTITTMEASENITPEMVEVYTAHEIKHALTYQWLEDNNNKASVKYLENAIEVADRKLEQIPMEDQTELLGLLKDRIQYAKKSGKNGVAELVAILSSEPNIRKEFMKQFPQQQKSRLGKILDAVKEFLGLGTDKVIATVDAIVAAGKIEDVKTDEFMEIYQEIGENNANKVPWQRAFVSTSEETAPTPTSGVVSELNAASPRHVRVQTKEVARKDSPITIVRMDATTVWATYPNGKKEYALPINEVTLDQKNVSAIYNKYNKEYQRFSNQTSMDSNPFLFNAIRERLLSFYPEITSKKVDKIVDEHGINAIGSAIGAIVEYTEEASVDTLPHEYAHIYINLLETTTFMSNTIKKVKDVQKLSTAEAKEYIADKMGKGYVKLMEGYPLDTRTLWAKITDLFFKAISPSYFRQLDMMAAVNEVTTRLYNGTNADGIRLTPKKGTKKVDPTFDFDNQPFSAGILKDIMNSVETGAVLFTGSEALAMQGDVYRQQGDKGTDLHDLDFAFNDRKELKTVSDMLKSKGATQIYDFQVPVTASLEKVAEKVANVLPITSSMFVPLGKLAKATKLLPTLAIETFIMADDNLKVTDIKRYKDQTHGRVISYNLKDDKGNVKGTYKAEVEEVNKMRTKIVSETTTGSKAVIVDLLEDKNRTDNFIWKYDGVDVVVSGAEDIFTAKNKMAKNTPRDKDVIDANSFYNLDFQEESLGAALKGISSEEFVALKILNDQASTVKAKESGIIPMIARGKAIKEARSIIEKAMKDCKGS